MITFPHISLFRNVLAYVKHVNTDPEVPTQYRIDKPVTFTGSIKLHGSNCGVVWTPDGTLQAQTREQVLSLPSGDYKGFAQFVAGNAEQITKLVEHVRQGLTGEIHKVALYGEWVGAGVIKRTKGVAVSKFERKHWALFAAAVVRGDNPEAENVSDALAGIQVFLDGAWVVEGRIGCVNQVDGWKITVDFSDPASIEAGKAEAARITATITEQCPYGALYDLEGAGEGIVWMPTGDFAGREDLYWKHKSETHSVVDQKVQKVRKVVPDDVQASINDFVAATVTDNRLEQGLDALEQQGLGAEKRNTGKFIQWLSADVERECTLELEEAGLQWSQVSAAVTTRARIFFLATAK